MYRRLRPLLFSLDPEWVHGLVYQGTRWATRALPADWLRCSDPVTLLGLTFPNRIGLAAGFDKHGHFVRAASVLGFGHIEVGAVTPLPQQGQKRPRLFRCPPGSLRNHMGFNNDGVEDVVSRLQRPYPLVLGINLGKGLHTPLEDALDDYLAVLRRSEQAADYFSVNISSPNTQGLRELSQREPLLRLCSGLRAATRRPLLLKVSPDEADDALAQIAEVVKETGFEGMIATNTTVRREGAYAHVPERGGLSGLALKERSPQVVGLLRQCLGLGPVLVGVGGVDDGESALAMRRAGADLVQVYSGLVYQGPALPRQLARALKEAP